ncbi:hypothetical protein [Actinoplanes sp. NPDC051859]|uniref:hypothetical protein n=1 Tax=Actinoplanes sp. NPDC051859 TaxID=3363909 RepID=UPI0037A6ACFA
MAIEWEARVNRRLTVADVVEQTERFLADLLPVPGRSFTVSIHEATAERLRGGTSRPVVDAELTTVRDPFGAVESRSCDLVFEILELEAAAFVHLAEHIPRDADPETGMFAFVSSSRTNVSQVLSIATVAAFAKCGDSEVVDDSLRFGESRCVPPDRLVKKLAADGAVSTVEDAAVSVLRKTRLRSDL